VHLELFNEFGAFCVIQACERMIVGFVQELHTTGVCKLLERIEKAGVPAFALFNENSGKPVGNFKLSLTMFEPVDLFQYGVVCWKVTFSGGSFENMLVKVIVKIQAEKVVLSNEWSREYVGMKISVQT